MKTVALSEISDSIDYGVTASAKNEPVGPRFLRITDIQNGSVDWAAVPYCEGDRQKLASSRLRAGDIVFARTGATTGKSFLNEIARSLAPDASKIWICERLYCLDGGSITDIGFAALADAERSLAKLGIPKWTEAINPKTRQKGEGLRAPFPGAEYSWLDLKGGFLDAEGNPGQIKPQDKRAEQIHNCGWT
jgi:hypothetical protein